jgi:alpha-galactosidase
MGIVSGATLVVVGIALMGPAWITPLTTDVTADTVRIGDGETVVVPAQFPLVPPTGRLALTPPMGWNGFNHFFRTVTEATVEAEASALVASGMQAAGYRYVNLDGGWDLMHRNAAGALQPDPWKFPNGIKPVADYVHNLGLKFGIYASAGVMNCAATSAGSYGHYQQDAAMFAAWGVDYVKFDWCWIPFRSYPHMSHRQVSEMLARQMAAAMVSTKRSMVYDINDWTNDEQWLWARGIAHMWRTTHDSHDLYSSLLSQFLANVGHHALAGPGGWNDPDMLEVGNGGMSAIEYQSQFSLWAEMAAPLIAGNDLTRMSAVTRSILTNQAVIAVDQDPLGRQGYPVTSAGGHWVLTKPLMNGDEAVVLFNQTNSEVLISTTAEQIGAAYALRGYALLNLWDGTVVQSPGEIAAVVPPHGVVMYVVSQLRPSGA